jgi:magnesium-transporting ATPase (P-type)
VSFGVFWWWLGDDRGEGAVRSAQNATLLLMVLFELFHLGNCRSETRSAFAMSPLRSPLLLVGTVLAFLVHLGAMHSPFGPAVLGAAPLSASHWLILVGAALSIVAVMEAHKWLWARRAREGATAGRLLVPCGSVSRQ